jgi:hypothetical protein
VCEFVSVCVCELFVYVLVYECVSVCEFVSLSVYVYVCADFCVDVSVCECGKNV